MRQRELNRLLVSVNVNQDMLTISELYLDNQIDKKESNKLKG